MTDNWSLEDKAYYVWRWSEGGIEPEKGLRAVVDQHLLHDECIIYDKPTINKLREKLIEDINDACNSRNYEREWIEMRKEDVIDLINKRFGVEE